MAATDAAASTPPSTARDRQSAAAAPTAVVSAVSGLIAAGVYSPTEQLEEDFFLGSAEAINRLTERIVESMEQPW